MTTQLEASSPYTSVPRSGMFRSMWNTAPRGTLELANGFMAALHTYVPYGVECSLTLPHEGDSRADAILDARIGGENVAFLLNTKSGDTPDGSSSIAPQRRDLEVPVALARYLSPTARSSLTRAGWSYWDTTGNVRLVSESPLIVIERQGAQRDPDPSQAGAPRQLKGLGGAATARVMVYLLTQNFAPSVRELADRTKTSVGTVSRVVALLRNENLLTATGSDSIRIENKMDLIRRWVEDYDFFAANNAARYRSPLGLDGASMAIERNLETATYAYSGLEAAKRWLAVFTPSRTFELPVTDRWLYVTSPVLAEQAASLIPDRRGDIVLATGDFLNGGVNEEGSNDRARLRSVWAWRVAADLMSQPGRHAAMGEQLAEVLAAKGDRLWTSPEK